MQDEIARSVVEKLKVKLLGAADAPLVKRPTRSVDAYHLYLRGHQVWQRATRDGYETAIEYLHRALSEDPTYAQAYAELAMCYASYAFLGHAPPREVYPKVRAAAQKAIDLGPTSAEAHAALGMTSLFFAWDWEKAERHLRQAITCNPSYVMGHLWYAYYLLALGRPAEGIAHGSRAQELDPISVETAAWFGSILFNARQYDRAIDQLEQTRTLDPNHPLTLFFLGMAYPQMGLHQKAIEDLERGVAVSGRDQGFLALLGYAYAVSGQAREAGKVLDELQEVGARGYLDRWNVALVHTGLGDADRAIDWLNKAYEDRAGWMVWLNTFPLLDPLRSDPRFQDLLRRMNFPQQP